jgi:hypothetical protein
MEIQGIFSITNTDKEIVNHVYEFAKQQNLNIRVKEDNISYHVTSNLVGVNHVTKELRRLNLLKISIYQQSIYWIVGTIGYNFWLVL